MTSQAPPESTTIDKSEATAGGIQYHLKIGPGDANGFALLPGDPFRVARIESRLDDPRELAFVREYRTVVGTYKGTGITAMSTGMGCPSAAIAVEELRHCGAHTFIRVGSTAALQPGIEVGDLIVSTGSLRNDGTTAAYVPPGYPAVPDLELTASLVEVAREVAEERGVSVHVGLNVTDDAFYAEGPEWIEKMSSIGMLNVEMESSAIFTVAHLRGLRAGMICSVSANLVTGDAEYHHEGADPRLARGWDDSIDIALEAAHRLEQRS